MKVVVLGAGVSGVMTAYELARAGHAVEVVDRQTSAGEETSFANGGMIGGTQVEPWAQPGLPRKVLSWIGREDAPLLLRMGQVPAMWRWGLRFLANCTESRLAENLAANVALTRYSMERFPKVRAEAGLDGTEYDLNTTGALKVYFDRGHLDAVRAGVAEIAGQGIPVEEIDGDACRRREPALAGIDQDIAGGFLYPGDEIGDCRQFTKTMAGVAEGLGVRFRWNTAVTGFARSGNRVGAVETDAGPVTGDAFVVAMASHSPGLLRGLGIRLPVIPVRGVSVTVPAGAWNAAPRGAVIDHTRLFGMIRIGDRLRIAGLAEVAGYDTQPPPVRIKALTDNVLDLFPDFAACLAAGEPRIWAGLRGVSPDSRPILGPTPVSNVFLNAGHGPQGWSTSCGAAKVAADLVTGAAPEIDWRPYALERFG